MFSKDTYIERRRVVRERMADGVGIFLGNGEMPMSYADNCYPFIQDSTFLYLFGMNRPDLIGVIDFESGKEYIFGRDFTLDDVIWMGPQKPLREEAKKYGIENFMELEELPVFIERFREQEKKIYHTIQYRDENRMKLGELLGIAPKDVDKEASLELTKIIIEERNIKSDAEIRRIEEAVNITREMHLEAMRVVKPGMKEYEVAAAVEAVAKRNNATVSFPTICTKHGEILHNHSQEYILEEGDMLLLDCGARTKEGYCGDMTTTIPVSGMFNERQKNIYALLMAMFETAEKMMKPGVTYKEVHLEVCKTLAQGMVERELMKGDVNEIVELGAHALFFPHGLGHMLGMDVHDMENLGETLVGYGNELVRSTQFGLKSLRLGRMLQEGFVFTVEPGIYFIPELIKKWKEEKKFLDYINYEKVEEYLDFGGMRYEGDYLVTENGVRRLGKKMPKYYYEIEEAMR